MAYKAPVLWSGGLVLSWERGREEPLTITPIKERNMADLRIERYDGEVSEDYAGIIEPRDRSWIIYLDNDGKPALYWPQRDERGAVIGNPVRL